MTKDPVTTVPAVKAIGRNRTAPASMTASLSSRPSANRASIKSINKTLLRTIMPASAITPIIDVAVKKAPNIRWPGMIPSKVKGIGIIISRGTVKFWNIPTISR